MDLRKIQHSLDHEFNNLLFEGLFSNSNVYLLEETLIQLASDCRVQKLVPQVADRLEALYSARHTGNTDKREDELLDLYLLLHGAGSEYEPEEMNSFRASQGIACLPGGILPLILCSWFINPWSTVSDLGCGNGLQGLLLQVLFPHRKTVQVELSGNLISTGKLYQHILGLDSEEISWFHKDIADMDLSDIDLIYMYRPVRPSGAGAEVYRKIAEQLSRLPHTVTIISMADCLNAFLGNEFSICYRNDFLTIFSSAN